MVEVDSGQEDMDEKLKNMNPEQLREFQKQQCIFCQIISGKVQSKKIYEDEKCIAVLDINPANPGHILLLPKEHYSVMPQIPEQDIGHLFIVSKALSSAMLRGLKTGGTNIFVANGAAAGQRAQHFMIHIIPRKENDGISSFRIPQRQIPDSDLEAIKKRMVAAMAGVFGMEAPKAEESQNAEEVEKPEDRAEAGKEVENKDAEKKRDKKKSGKQKEAKEIKAEKIDIEKIAGLFK
jgi:histidine triad (HIT) family protein